jgi:hypothetical protein
MKSLLGSYAFVATFGDPYIDISSCQALLPTGLAAALPVKTNELNWECALVDVDEDEEVFTCSAGHQKSSGLMTAK